jgi:hypothetical protein
MHFRLYLPTAGSETMTDSATRLRDTEWREDKNLASVRHLFQDITMAFA